MEFLQSGGFDDLVSGKAPDQDYLYYLLIYLAMMGLVIILSIFFYSGPYSIIVDYISNLGENTDNPAGFEIFNIGLMILGLAGLPLYIYTYGLSPNFGKAKNQEKGPSRLVIAFSIVSSIGVAFVGIFPATNRKPHLIAAGMVFLGLFLANNLQFRVRILALTSEYSRKGVTASVPHKKLSHLKAPYRRSILIYYIISVIFFVSLLYQDHIIPASAYRPGIFSTAFWEWSYFLSCIGMTVFWFLDRYSQKSPASGPQSLMQKKSNKQNQDSIEKSPHARQTGKLSPKNYPFQFPSCTKNPRFSVYFWWIITRWPYPTPAGIICFGREGHCGVIWTG